MTETNTYNLAMTKKLICYLLLSHINSSDVAASKLLIHARGFDLVTNQTIGRE